jgi:hypothetical protein
VTVAADELVTPPPPDHLRADSGHYPAGEGTDRVG